jgi:site-specific DNA-cytosine methylase
MCLCLEVAHTQCGFACKARRAKLHIAGTPCVDFSTRGLQAKENGPTLVFLLCWIAMRIMLQEMLVIQENVADFTTNLLLQWLGHLYHIDVCILCPSACGWPVARRRKYTVLRHRYKTRCYETPFNIFSSLFSMSMFFGVHTWDEDIAPFWDVFFVASQEELLEEKQWGQSRPESRYKAMTGTPHTFYECLTAKERLG